jgi:hypothetical protein
MLDRRQGERGHKTKACVKLAAKMPVVVWTMLKNNEPFLSPYSPDYDLKNEERKRVDRCRMFDLTFSENQGRSDY